MNAQKGLNVSMERNQNASSEIHPSPSNISISSLSSNDSVSETRFYHYDKKTHEEGCDKSNYSLDVNYNDDVDCLLPASSPVTRRKKEKIDTKGKAEIEKWQRETGNTDSGLGMFSKKSKRKAFEETNKIEDEAFDKSIDHVRI